MKRARNLPFLESDFHKNFWPLKHRNMLSICQKNQAERFTFAACGTPMCAIWIQHWSIDPMHWGRLFCFAVNKLS